MSGDGAIVAIGQTHVYFSKVHVFEYNRTVWSLRQTITGDGNIQLGRSVALSFDGSVLAIGAEDFFYLLNCVQVYNWNITTYDIRDGNIYGTNGGSENDNFGFNISLSADGTVVAILAEADGVNQYVVMKYWNESTWMNIGDPIHVEDITEFGSDVSLRFLTLVLRPPPVFTLPA